MVKLSQGGSSFLAIVLASGLGVYTYSRHLFNLYPSPPIGLHDSTVARVPLTTLPEYTSAFYKTWTLRLEGFAAQLAGNPVPPDSFLNGLFVVKHRSAQAVEVEWSMPKPVTRLFKALGVGMVQGGSQILSVQDKDGETEIRYTCEEYLGVRPERWEDVEYRRASGIGINGKPFGAFGVQLHRLYMRFLIEQAKNRLVQGARRHP
ncbi:hypothetical protein L202_07491 [Cryptococcus amylolentus CBS 6039]|uniref:Uncharacterized protein n=2 Tax=Cryptococcus amylolentus TaxID=104669 RepID=A0A1E3HCD9_9TREE|nr:hypothetical protein L202_07491 [Cryptococcus amylolentus CBS 6039]ODN74008.1 hypothetical protein L202_07491 [Cryptococcus amylolentus CBS 6039]ODO00182.1 hypothetical protein I350_06807 [Cryptococcus amylolentus CBS 6273]